MAAKSVKALTFTPALLFSNVSAAYDDFDALMTLSIAELLQVEVESSTLTSQQVIDSPAAISVYNHDQIKRLGLDYLHELLSLVPGYQSWRGMDYSFQYSTSSRARRNGSYSREVLFLLNGAAINNPLSGNEGSAYLFPVRLIERVEIIRGPGSSLYGSNAFTGVVNIITRQNAKELSLGIGSDQRQLIDVQTHQSWNELSVSVSAFFEQDAGQTYQLQDTFSPNIIEVVDPLDSERLSLNAKYKDIYFDVTHHHINSEDFYNTGRLSPRYNFSELTTNLLVLGVNTQLWDEIESDLNYQFTEMETLNGNQSTPSGAFFAISEPASQDPLYGIGKFASERHIVSWKNNWQLDAQQSTQFGIELKRTTSTKAKGYTNFDLGDIANQTIPIRFYGNLNNGTPIGRLFSQDSHSIYWQYQNELSENLHTTLGFRYDKYQEYDEHVSPRLSFIYRSNENQSFKLLYGEAFRAPDFSESSLVNTVSILGNQQLEHEVVKTTELIWVKQWQQAQLQMGVFHNHYDGPIVDVAFDSIRTYINGNDETAQGFESEIQWQIGKQWLFDISGAYFWDLPDSAKQESSHTFSAQMNYQNDNINVSFSAVHNGERETPFTENQSKTLPAYWLVQGKLSYQINEQWLVTLSGKNLLNKTYYSPAQIPQLQNGVTNRGRSWLANVTYLF